MRKALPIFFLFTFALAWQVTLPVTGFGQENPFANPSDDSNDTDDEAPANPFADPSAPPAEEPPADEAPENPFANPSAPPEEDKPEEKPENPFANPSAPPADDSQDNEEKPENPFANPSAPPQDSPSDDSGNPFGDPPPSDDSGNPFGDDAPPADEPSNPFANPGQAPGSPFDDPPAPSAPSNPFGDSPGSGPGNPNPFGDNPPSPPSGSENPFDSPAAPPSGSTSNPFESAPTPVTNSPFETSQPTGDSSNPFESGGPTGTGRKTPLGTNIKGLYVDATAGGIQTIEQVQAMMREFQAASFNRLYVEVRTPFGVVYDSQFEASLPFITPGFPTPIPEIRQKMPRGAELIAVVTLLPAYNAAIGSNPPPTNPVGRFPELASQTLDGRKVASDNRIYYDPGNPKTVAYLKDFIRELDAKIQPDGYLFEGVKYPGKEWGYSEGAIEAFRAAVGGEGPPPEDDPVWCAWRRDRLSRLLTELRSALPVNRQSVYFAVAVDANEEPPQTWPDWVESTAYQENFVDWLYWCRDNVVDEIVLEVHERLAPQGNVLSDWVKFSNTNLGGTLPIISLDGGQNFINGFTIQYDTVRSRGVGTLLYQYTRPIRSKSRGFFGSLPNIVFRTSPGNPVPGIPLNGATESRFFAPMASPPPSVEVASADVAVEEPTILDPSNLQFTTPTPIPSPTPEAIFIPSQQMRTVTLTSGQAVNAMILEVSPSSIKLRPEGSSAIILSRSVIDKIDPPL